MDLIKELLGLEVPDSLKLSPDGKQVVYIGRKKWDHKPKKDEGHSRAIWIADTASEKSARKLTDGSFGDRAPQWSPDGKTIAFLSDRGGDRGKSCAIYLLQPSGEGEPKAITPAKSEQKISKFRFCPHGKHVYFMSTPEKDAEAKAREEDGDDVEVWGQGLEYAQLHRVNVENGEEETLFDQNAHAVDFALNDDGSELAVVTTKTTSLESDFLHGCDIQILQPGVGKEEVKRIIHLPRKVADITWSASTLYFISTNVLTDMSSGNAVHAIDLSASSGTEVSPNRIAHGEDDCALGLRKVGDKVLVYVQHDLEDQVRLLNSKAILSQKKKIVDYDVVITKEGSESITMVAASGDINHPTEVFTVNTTSSFLSTQLSNHGASFTDRPFAGAVTVLSCPTLDGKETLSALYLTPVTAAAPQIPLPTYVSIHGGPYMRQNEAADSWDPVIFYAPLLLSTGIGVLVANYRGNSSRGQRFASYAGLRGGLGKYDEPDIVALTQHAVSLGLADPQRLAVGGWSQGGYLSYLSAVRNGTHGGRWRFRCAVPGAGVTDWDAMTLTSDFGYFQAALAGCSWRSDKDDVGTRGGSAMWELKGAVAEGRVPPVLMVHGEKDARVPVTQAWGFRRALDEAGLPFQLATYPREGHFIQETKHLEDMVERVVNFVKEHLL